MTDRTADADLSDGDGELRRAHDTIAEVYAEMLVDSLARMPIERAVLGLFCDLVLESGDGRRVADVGSGSGHLAPFLAGRGLEPRGVDLSPDMVRVARRDFPEFGFEVGDVRALPFATASLDGVVGWYSLMYLHPPDRPRAFAEVARVVRPGGHLAVGFKLGDDTLRRGGKALDVEFDIYWMSHAELAGRVSDAGFEVLFTGERPAQPDDPALGQPQGYLIARRT